MCYLLTNNVFIHLTDKRTCLVLIKTTKQTNQQTNKQTKKKEIQIAEEQVPSATEEAAVSILQMVQKRAHALAVCLLVD